MTPIRFYFLADYHALVKCEDPERVQRFNAGKSRPPGWRWGWIPAVFGVLSPIRYSGRFPS